MDVMERTTSEAVAELERLFACVPGPVRDEVREFIAGSPTAAQVESYIENFFAPMPDDVADAQQAHEGGTTTAPPFSRWAYDRLSTLTDEARMIDARIAALEAQRVDVLSRCNDWAQQMAELHLDVARSETVRRERAEQTVILELSCALRIPRQTVATQLSRAVEVRALPATFAALSQGTISRRHAEVIADGCIGIPKEDVPAVESELAAVAPTTTAAIVKNRARRLREAHHPESLAERATSARGDRRVTFEAADDGMSSLWLYSGATDGMRVFEALTEAGIAARKQGDPRTLAQLRADLLVELVLGGGRLRGGAAGGARRDDLDALTARARASAQPRVFVTVPVMTLLGKSDEPGNLDGYGPIDAETARELAAEAPSFYRLLTDPISGAVLDLDRDTYRVPADLQRWLMVRDGTCRAPCSNTRAVRCDIDHTDDWQFGGGTDHDNLAHLSRAWHTAKHKLGWRVVQREGALIWTSPAGRMYATKPAIPIASGTGRRDARCTPAIGSLPDAPAIWSLHEAPPRVGETPPPF